MVEHIFLICEQNQTFKSCVNISELKFGQKLFKYCFAKNSEMHKCKLLTWCIGGDRNCDQHADTPNCTQHFLICNKILLCAVWSVCRFCVAAYCLYTLPTMAIRTSLECFSQCYLHFILMRDWGNCRSGLSHVFYIVLSQFHWKVNEE